MKVAYLVNQYPMISHSFIRREIQALEKRGLVVSRISMRGWSGPLADRRDLEERERTQYVLRGGAMGLVKAIIGRAFRSPARFVQAAWLAARMSRNSNRGLHIHGIYFAEACWIVPRLARAGVQHVHAHFGTNPAEVAMLVNALCGVPFSFTVHGIAELDKPEAIGLAEKIHRAAFVVGVCSYVRAQLYRWAGPEQWDKIKVVHCGIEPSFHDVPRVPVPSRPRLVCVARLSEEKGQLILIRAAALLAREGIPFEIVLAGDGEMRRRIEAEIAQLNLASQVRITGWIDSERVREEILVSRALVLPSFAEGLPVVIMEAMALRRPVLSTYVAGIPELVVNGETGWLFPAGAVQELAAAMKACLGASNEILDAMGDRARNRALERHDVECEAERLAGYFRNSVDDSPLVAGRAAWA